MDQLITVQNQQTLETLLGNAKSLPIEYVIYIFGKFESRYLNLWVDNVSSLSIEKLVHDWAVDLADMTTEELKRGLESSMSEKYPPSIQIFREHCRPTLPKEESPPHSEMYKLISPLPKEESQLKKEDIDKIFGDLKKIIAGDK